MRFEAAADWGPPAGTPPMLQDGVKDTRDGSWVVRSISSADARWYAAVLSARYIDGKLYLAWKGVGDDPRLFFSSSADGVRWADQVQVGGGTSHGPALASFPPAV